VQRDGVDGLRGNGVDLSVRPVPLAMRFGLKSPPYGSALTYLSMSASCLFSIRVLPSVSGISKTFGSVPPASCVVKVEASHS
jgi:hypothetical protein